MSDEESAGTRVALWLATNVRERREQLGLSQSEVARRMVERGHRFHQATVYKVESGARPLSHLEAVGIARVLGVDQRVLTMPPATQRRTARLQQHTEAVISAFDEAVRAVRTLTRRHERLSGALATVGEVDPVADRPLAEQRARAVEAEAACAPGEVSPAAARRDAAEDAAEDAALAVLHAGDGEDDGEPGQAP